MTHETELGWVSMTEGIEADRPQVPTRVGMRWDQGIEAPAAPRARGHSHCWDPEGLAERLRAHVGWQECTRE